jgi:transcriptional regulator with XRE-family HTH domain
MMDPGHAPSQGQWHDAEDLLGRAVAPHILDMAAISHRITLRREQLELKQLDLARQVGMSEAYINRLENGVVRNPKILDLAQVAQALDLPLKTLLYGEASEPEESVFVMLTCPPGLARALSRLLRGFQHASADRQELIINRLEVLGRRLMGGP